MAMEQPATLAWQNKLPKIMGRNYLYYEMDSYNLFIYQLVANNFRLTD